MDAQRVLSETRHDELASVHAATSQRLRSACAVRWVAAWLVKGQCDVTGAGAVTSCEAYTWHSADTVAQQPSGFQESLNPGSVLSRFGPTDPPLSQTVTELSTM